MNTKALQFLVLGGGSIGKRHIRNLQSLGYSSIYCLKRQKDEAFEKENQVKVVTSLEELKNQKIAAVLVCTPTALHNEGLYMAKALDAAVLMEKPLINGKEGYQEALHQLAGFSRPFFIAFMLRYHPLVQKLKQLIDGESLGKVYAARFEFGSFLPYWHPWEDHRISYASIPALGGGVINTITHELDLIQYFFGTPAAVSCTAVNLKKLDIQVEEMAEAVFEYDDKLVSLHLDYLQKDYDRRITILCDEGTIRWNWHDNKVVLKKHKGAQEEFSLEGFDVNQLYIDELKAFLSLLDGSEQRYGLDAAHALENTRLTLLMHASAKAGKKMKTTEPLEVI